MFAHYRTEGLIIKKENRGEADQLFTIYTKDFGKLKILGRAIRKIGSKLRGNLQLLSISEIEFIQGKNYKTLTDTLLIENFSKIKNDLKKLKIAYQIGDILDNLVSGEEPDEKIWNLLNETFAKLNDCSLFTAHCSLLYYYFLWNLFSILGYKPELHNCIFCQQTLKPEKLFFSPKEGGIICNNCTQRIKADSISTDPNTVKIIRLFLEKNWQILRKLKVEKSNFQNLKDISRQFLTYILAQSK